MNNNYYLIKNIKITVQTILKAKKIACDYFIYKNITNIT